MSAANCGTNNFDPRRSRNSLRSLQATELVKQKYAAAFIRVIRGKCLSITVCRRKEHSLCSEPALSATKG